MDNNLVIGHGHGCRDNSNLDSLRHGSKTNDKSSSKGILLDMSKICEELLDVLVKNEVPVMALSNVFDELDILVRQRTIIQNNK